MKLASRFKCSFVIVTTTAMVASVLLIAACQVAPRTSSRRMEGEGDQITRFAQARGRDTTHERSLDRSLGRYPSQPAPKSQLPRQQIVWEDVSYKPPVTPTLVSAARAAQVMQAYQNTALPTISNADQTSPAAPADAAADAGVDTEPIASDATSVDVLPDALDTTSRPADASVVRKMTRTELIHALVQQIQDEDASSALRTLRLVALKTVDPNVQLDSAAMDDLGADQREFFQKLEKMLGDLEFEAGHKSRDFQPGELIDQLKVLAADKPLSIRTIELCSRVVSYGVYDPIEQDTFIVGQVHPMIVYVELDHFKAQKQNDGLYRVKLSQEVTLCTEADGLPVWRHPRAEVIDESRNIRRDFFNVQLIRLPARLSVGKYRLKVSVTDHHGGTMDEAIIPISIVADSSLVSSRKSPAKELSNRN